TRGRVAVARIPRVRARCGAPPVARSRAAQPPHRRASTDHRSPGARREPRLPHAHRLPRHGPRLPVQVRTAVIPATRGQLAVRVLATLADLAPRGHARLDRDHVDTPEVWLGIAGEPLFGAYPSFIDIGASHTTDRLA